MKKFIIIFCVLLALLVAYLFGSYRFFYYKLHTAGLKWPDSTVTYVVDKKAPTTKVYVAMGDSLTSGVGAGSYYESYPYLLAQSFANENQNVILKNRSYPGYTTGDLIKNMLEPAIADKPDIITILIGVNDAHRLVSPATDYEKKYDVLLQKLTTQTSAKIYIISVPHLGSRSIVLPPYNFLFDHRTKVYNEALQNLAAKYNVTYIDIYSPTVTDLKNSGSWYSADDYHPSAEGYQTWARLINRDTN